MPEIIPSSEEATNLFIQQQLDEAIRLYNDDKIIEAGRVLRKLDSVHLNETHSLILKQAECMSLRLSLFHIL